MGVDGAELWDEMGCFFSEDVYLENLGESMECSGMFTDGVCWGIGQVQNLNMRRDRLG